MNETKIEKSDSTELMELTQDTTPKKMTPFEEYRKGIRRRRGKAFLFILLFLIEATLGVLLLGGVFAENLHYRVTMQIENNLNGENKFATGTYLGETDFG